MRVTPLSYDYPEWKFERSGIGICLKVALEKGRLFGSEYIDAFENNVGQDGINEYDLTTIRRLIPFMVTEFNDKHLFMRHFYYLSDTLAAYRVTLSIDSSTNEESLKAYKSQIVEFRDSNDETGIRFE